MKVFFLFLFFALAISLVVATVASLAAAIMDAFAKSPAKNYDHDVRALRS